MPALRRILIREREAMIDGLRPLDKKRDRPVTSGIVALSARATSSAGTGNEGSRVRALAFDLE